ncbi:MAG: zinc ribbon domain-containing protein [Gemmatimonadetes bacterium]|nr:zinc ribbon domain-containing protein [Gemmatimonadota bacterium]MYH17500.1 zinc ribbon domain-containing protein [Gemmatimonadota bacterium]MYK97257.1 zinc ribbon domain-containing protein [Gemmatimonadota bacterium]
MTLVACGLLALGVLAYMISPMLDGSVRRPRIARSAGSRRDDLLKKKDFIYSSIRELNIDYNMGKLAAEDHEALRQEYMKEASDVLDELDRTAVSDLPVEEQIEEAVREIRRRSEPGSEETVTVDDDAAGVKEAKDEVDGDEAAVEETAVNAAAEDATAGGAPAEDARPVPSAQVQVCRICRTVNEASARFCIECGVSLKTITCAGCGAENPASARFCAQCGGKLI